MFTSYIVHSVLRLKIILELTTSRQMRYFGYMCAHVLLVAFSRIECMLYQMLFFLSA